MAKTRILIVDDDEPVRDALQRWFGLHGFEADVAEDGLEAVEKCGSGEYDVILMDLEMPRMGGLEAMARIRGLLPGVPVLVLTGYGDVSNQSVLSDASKVLFKPLPLREIEKAVRELLAWPAS